MDMNGEFKNKFENSLFEMKLDDFQVPKHYFKTDNKGFVNYSNRYLSNFIKKKEDIDKFLFLFNHLKNELIDISPFLSSNINRIFGLMIKNNYFKQVAEYSYLLESCANIKTLELLDEFILSKNMIKFLSNVEIYKIKKLVFDLSNKFKRSDIAIKIQVELEKEDLNWIDTL
jgi:hypothetical protein